MTVKLLMKKFEKLSSHEILVNSCQYTKFLQLQGCKIMHTCVVNLIKYTYIFRKLATVLVQRGKLLNNSILVTGTSWGKVRVMMDHQNNVLREANPSDAIQIIGWKDLPQAGLEFLQVSSDVLL